MYISLTACKYLCGTVSNVLVKLEGHSVITILQLVSGHRLVVCIASLGCHTSHTGSTTKIHLKPLIKIISERWPSASLGMQPGLYCGVVSIQLGGRAYLVIRDWLPSHAKRCYTSYNWNWQTNRHRESQHNSCLITCYFTTRELELSIGFKTPNFLPYKGVFTAIDSANCSHLKLVLVCTPGLHFYTDLRMYLDSRKFLLSLIRICSTVQAISGWRALWLADWVYYTRQSQRFDFRETPAH